jgi:predicted PurR-regulated permease PerM
VRERTIYIGIGLVFGLGIFLYLLYQLSAVVLTLMLALLFAIILGAPVDYLDKKGLGRGLSLLVVLGVLALVVWLAGLAISPVVERQTRQFAEQFPQLLDEVFGLVGRVQEFFGLNLGPQLQPSELQSQLVEIGRNFLSGGVVATVADIGGSIVNVVSLGFVMLITVIYLVLSPISLVNGFVALFPAERRQRVREILSGMYGAVQRWFLGQLTSMVIIGVLSVIALSIIGIPFAVLIGIFSGLISFVPFIGPIISVFPPAILALLGNPLDVVWVVLAYLVIQAVESNLIQPIVMSRAVSLHPAVVVFALLIMGTLFGFVGLLLAVPLVAALHVLLQELWIERMDEVGEDPNPPKKAGVERHRPMRLRRLSQAVRRRFRS